MIIGEIRTGAYTCATSHGRVEHNYLPTTHDEVINLIKRAQEEDPTVSINYHRGKCPKTWRIRRRIELKDSNGKELKLESFDDNRSWLGSYIINDNFEIGPIRGKLTAWVTNDPTIEQKIIG